MAFSGNEWKPTKEQAEFIQLPWSIKEGFFGGAKGGGKSDLLLILPLILKLHENPGFKQLFTRRTFAELKKEIIPRSRELYRKFGATWNGSDMAWTFPRPEDLGGNSRKNEGAMIFMGHCEHEKDVQQYDSMEINLFTPDELQSFTEYIYTYIAFTRVRTSDKTLPAIIRGAGMPGGIGHTFVKNRFVDPYEKMGRIDGITDKDGITESRQVLKDKRTGNKRFYVKANFDTNPHIDPGYRQSIEELPLAERNAAKGDWNAFSGQVFSEFREFHYPDEPDNALHVVELPEIPAWWPRICVGDWGMRAMTWVGFGAISPKGRCYIYRELAWRNTKISEWAPVVKSFLDKENIKLLKFCKSAGQDRGQEHTIQQQLEAELGREVELTTNSPGSRIAGKMLIHEYLRWKPRPKILDEEAQPLVYDENFAMQLLRLKGKKSYEDYLNLFSEKSEDEEILPKLLIGKDLCPELVEAIKACGYDKKKIEDIAEFDGDDPIDGLRYLVDAVEGYVKGAQKEFNKLERQSELERRLAATQNHTAFYMGMRALENSTGRLNGVKRYKRH